MHSAETYWHAHSTDGRVPWGKYAGDMGVAQGRGWAGCVALPACCRCLLEQPMLQMGLHYLLQYGRMERLWGLHFNPQPASLVANTVILTVLPLQHLSGSGPGLSPFCCSCNRWQLALKAPAQYVRVSASAHTCHKSSCSTQHGVLYASCSDMCFHACNRGACLPLITARAGFETEMGFYRAMLKGGKNNMAILAVLGLMAIPTAAAGVAVLQR